MTATESAPVLNAPKFNGYYASLTNHEGQVSPCYVVNSRSEMKFSDGTTGAALKVKVGHKYLVQGGHRYATSYAAQAIWVKASRVSA